MTPGSGPGKIQLHDLKRLDTVLKEMVRRIQELRSQASRTPQEEQELDALIADFGKVGDHLVELLDKFPNVPSRGDGRVREVNTASFPKWPHDCWSP